MPSGARCPVQMASTWFWEVQVGPKSNSPPSCCVQGRSSQLRPGPQCRSCVVPRVGAPSYPPPREDTIWAQVEGRPPP